MIYGTFGIHPHETNKQLVTKDEIILNVNSNKKIIGVGESGLDFYYNNSNKENQILSFENHISAAIELKVPIVVHSRNAENETYEILNQYNNKNLKILMHCFTGSKEFAKKLMKMNVFFSASGIITFKNAETLRNTVKNIPLERILVETDAPYLSPVPLRGKRNEPAFVTHTAKFLAELFNISSEELNKITTNNFFNLFTKASLEK